uniref:JmjC domain-containing protein n=1 Tax=Phaeomonas parva TaxID=124430 RepID=A0A7S1TU82_9STRA|mmetsp:Transcript_18045/g.55317  ORF Transcript_18045/g.55317 Transcript_18045/m.55317 type:complete len:544 (+) Transcript_18045:222-1853(+)|eukprot:CAMPEP_0118855672 /NCGR_PEP_ID=MMETSP1163-20130328/3404_1 /TAXON_ID=124430 /ORGANISM="Phaeomonas parva, Strain CCMP2877" /LENGTH=543 /DNA_ID=CAMNT_0006788601 /DNA_START=233 /DNA_END=1864 /DNA_ORIENTATION=-
MEGPSRKRQRLQAALLARQQATAVARLRRPHPYGVRPAGNLLLLEDAERRRRLRAQAAGLGRFAVLTSFADDSMKAEPLLEVLGYLTGAELARAALSGRTLSAFANAPELWRDACLRRGGDIRYAYSWRDTYAHAAGGAAKPHAPLDLRVYHNALHRAWCCGNFELRPEWLVADDVPKADAADLSVDAFIEKYERPNMPVVLRGCLRGWAARDRWARDAYLIEACGDAKLRATSPAAPMAVRFTAAEYLAYCKAPPQEEAPLYLFERDFLKLCPKLKDDFCVPKYFDPEAETEGRKRPTDLFRLYGAERRPDYRWLIAGPKASGSVFHIDPNSTNAWNAAVRGRKRWILYPPGCEPPPGVMPSADGADVTLPLGLGEWFLSFWAHHELRRQDPEPSRRPLEVTCEEGETIFVPAGWWHLVLNLDDVCVAITQNYVSASNLKLVVDFLKYKEDQISGVRDRLQDGEEGDVAAAVGGTSAAVQPEQMHRELVEAMERDYPEVFQAECGEQPAAEAPCQSPNPKPKAKWSDLQKQNDSGFSFGFSL